MLLYRNIGENEKAIACANRMPELCKSREVLLAGAEDGKEEAKYVGELLLKMADLYLYLSRLEWKRGLHDDAFGSLDEALRHARALDQVP